MKKTLILIPFVLLIAVLLYIIYQDSLPPRTPIKVARLLSGLPIPYDSRIVEFKDQWNGFNGDGYSYIILQLDSVSYNEVYDKAMGRSYKNLPITEPLEGPFWDISRQTAKGIYHVHMDDSIGMSFSGTTLSDVDRRVIVYISVN